MRTTVTLDPDVEQLVRRRMRERGQSFKEALNDAIRQASIGRQGDNQFQTPTVSMGEPAVPIERALQLAGALEDEELVRRLSTGS